MNAKNEIEKVILTRESYDELNDNIKRLEIENGKLLNRIEKSSKTTIEFNLENIILKEYIVNNMVKDLTYYLGVISKNEILDKEHYFRDNRNELKKLNIDEELFENAMIKKWNEIKEAKLSEDNKE